MEAQESDPRSSLARVRNATSVRRTHRALTHGAFAWDTPRCRDGVVAFRRTLAGEQTVLCIANMGAKPSSSIEGTLLCASGDVTGGVVPPDTTAWFAVD